MEPRSRKLTETSVIPRRRTATQSSRALRFDESATLLECGVRVEEVEDPWMRKLRYLDKLIDELAKGKKMETILRE